ncbi:hypothetical protein [Desulfovibrio sp. ZJ369]|uniref:hypothetical protein n=1 Tax=Desulfovibrio sp. ZJ369 TaxID=2709793 RepID=UPI0013ECD9FE|nr:hypothetical protein [Desulfovibrio sp. ZJ369]
MSAEQRNYEAAVSAISRQLSALDNVLVSPCGSCTPVPQEVAIELQHMLVHLFLASKATLTDYETRTTQLKHALGHLDRAMLDACKILISKNFPTLSQKLPFMKAWIALRQREGKDHFRGPSSFTNNTTCEKFYALLKNYSLITSGAASAANTIAHRPQGDMWSLYFKELGRWFQRELLYSSLCGEKSLDALSVMLQSFWTLDIDKLRELNHRLELDILVTNAAQAFDFGWDAGKTILKTHMDFIERYTNGQCTPEEIQRNYTSWVRQTFTSFLHFYGQDWPD